MVYLKAIEAHGFKSFADKVEIKFDAGVTAVVGPNGSGKSNITDAIRWVLGEQSARSIRGVRMEDVIFNGTTGRNPMNYAYVRLVLDNRSRTLKVEADEVDITRKLYRNGDSEYYINTDRCRLKEINELFLDSGLGRNAYNIISQGEVDEVLKAKPDQRRGLIEEAAGVMKYKLRKKESERRLEDTASNLDRVHDIIHELESRVTKLEKESAVAEEYLALKEEMRQSDIEVTVYDVNALLSMLEQETASLDAARRDIATERGNLSQLEQEIEQLSGERDAHDQKNRELNQRLIEASKKLEQTNGRIALYKERKNNRGQANEALAERLESHLARKESILVQEKEVEERLKELGTTERNLKTALSDTEKEKAALLSDQGEQIEKLKDRYYDLMVEKTTLENEQRRMQSEKTRLSGSIRQKQERLSELKETHGIEQAEHDRLKAEYESKTGMLEQKRADYQKEKENMAELEARYDEEREKLAQAERYIEQQRSKLDMLTSMQNEYRGYYPGARFILKSRQKMDGIIGSVGELLGADREYVTALDTALGGQAQNIVMQDETSAKRAIRMLKEKKAGFATFLPTDTIRPRNIHPDIRRTLDATAIDVKVMSDVVRHDERVSAVVSHLLGTTLVTRTIDDATTLAREINHRLRIVTMDGETIMPGGAMSGGSKNSKSSIIENQREHEDTKQRLESYETRTRELKASVDALGDTLADRMKRVEKLESEGKALADEGEDLLSGYRRLAYQLEARAENIALLEEELKGYEMPGDAADFGEKIGTVDRKLESLDGQIRRMSASDKDKKETLSQLNDEAHAIERELAAVRERISHSRSDRERLASERQDVLEMIQEIESQQKMVREDLDTLDIDALENEKAALERTVDGLNDETDEAATVQHEMRKQHESLQKSRDASHGKLDDLQERLRQHTGRKEKLDVQMEQKIEYLSETYRMTYDRAREEYDDFNGIDQKRMKISLNRKSIEELGPVNLGAIEEFERVNERYQFLKTQEADLLEARDTLLEVIAEMDEAVAVRFRNTFEQVNRHFGEVFREMFGGGQAELRLTEDGNYLDAGVEIYAQPPGKKLSTLSLLSGGERALTAISLLFSILKVRVSPFIILDEVEAALDESNVIRYARYLKQLARETQFIVITHRKGTMEESDRLFGVTMQERGVSQLISVDLKDYEENTREEETV